MFEGIPGGIHERNPEEIAERIHEKTGSKPFDCLGNFFRNAQINSWMNLGRKCLRKLERIPDEILKAIPEENPEDSRNISWKKNPRGILGQPKRNPSNNFGSNTEKFSGSDPWKVLKRNTEGIQGNMEEMPLGNPDRISRGIFQGIPWKISRESQEKFLKRSREKFRLELLGKFQEKSRDEFWMKFLKDSFLDSVGISEATPRWIWEYLEQYHWEWRRTFLPES